MELKINTLRREFATHVVARLQAAGFPSLWAGGCVRDLVMGKIPQDYDVATTATPDQVRHLFGRRFTLAVGESFGVIIVLGEETHALPAGGSFRPQVEVATFRSEGPYRDGRRPDHVAYSSPEVDARRRDFTINGMFFDPLTEKLLDYVGGQDDLQRGIVRAIGDADKRMEEDKLRLLRAVRFTAAFDFQMDPDTFASVKRLSSEIQVVSPERIAQELKKMLVHHRRRQAMELAQKTGLLAVIFPELIDGMANLGTDWKRTLTALEQLQSPRFEAAAAVLWHTVPSPPDGQLKGLPEFGTVRSICRRLRLSNLESELITWLTREQSAFKDIKTLRQCQLFRLLAEPAIEELLQVATAINDAYGGPTADVALARQVLNTVPAATFNPPVLIDGKTLIDLGLSPGPIFKSLLDAVRDAQLNAEIRTRAEAIVLLNHLRAENSP